MLPGFTAWPEETAARYRERGYQTGETFPALLDRVAAEFGGREAVVGTGLDGSPLRLTYAGLRDRALRLASGLHGLGIGHGDRVVVQCGNSPEFAVLAFALFRVGAIPVFALPAHRHTEIGHFLAASGAVAYFHTDEENAAAVAGQVRLVRHIASLGGLPDGPLPDPPAASDVALFQLSGGSTGLPKLIPRTHDDYAYSVRAGAEKIAAAEVEQVLLAHEDVADAAVVSIPDEHLGERSCAYVVARDAVPPKGSLLRAHVRRAGLAAFKVPDKVVFVAALPRTAVGKVDKKALRELHRKDS